MRSVLCKTSEYSVFTLDMPFSISKINRLNRIIILPALPQSDHKTVMQNYTIYWL